LEVRALARQLATVSQAAQAFNVSRETIRRWARAGTIPFYGTTQTWRFDLDEVRAALRKDAATSSTPARVEPDFAALDEASE
jgi:excisionase family DNA binding protein